MTQQSLKVKGLKDQVLQFTNVEQNMLVGALRRDAEHWAGKNEPLHAHRLRDLARRIELMRPEYEEDPRHG